MICVNFPSAILGAKRKAVLFNNKPQIDHIGWGFIFGTYREVIYCQKPLSITNSTEIKRFTYVFLHTKFYAASKKKIVFFFFFKAYQKILNTELK